jgi:CheY-like chemotaxis protein
VTDTGPGISREAQGRIFENFSQADGSTTRKHGGTGLGLAISKRLIERMGGEIWAESTEGEGSTFHFTLVGEAAPAPEEDPGRWLPPLDRDEPVAVRGPAPVSSLRVLLAEDQRVNQLVMLQMLGYLGYEADLAANGLEVLEALERQPYDVILMDVQMPGMDGLEATRRIRCRFPTGGGPQILALTAHAIAGDRERFLAAGMDGYLGKPVQMSDLGAALAALAAKR